MSHSPSTRCYIAFWTSAHTHRTHTTYNPFLPHFLPHSPSPITLILHLLSQESQRVLRTPRNSRCIKDFNEMYAFSQLNFLRAYSTTSKEKTPGPPGALEELEELDGLLLQVRTVLLTVLIIWRHLLGPSLMAVR